MFQLQKRTEFRLKPFGALALLMPEHERLGLIMERPVHVVEFVLAAFQ